MKKDFTSIHRHNPKQIKIYKFEVFPHLDKVYHMKI